MAGSSSQDSRGGGHDSGRRRIFSRAPLHSLSEGRDRTPLDGTPGGTDINTGDLFAWGARQRDIRVRRFVEPPRRNGSSFLLEGPSRYRIARNRQFAQYLVTRGFNGRSASGRLNAVRRNRIIFVAVLLALAGFVFYELVWR